jgi:PhzF family phenazine biosynthesis protein
MQLSIFQVDAFTQTVFSGNSAAVCPLDAWLPDAIMQKIALENAVAETAFFIPCEGGFAIRWFTPEIEMDLCGHATLATAHVIAQHLRYPVRLIRFQSKSGELTVDIQDDLLTLDFPSRPPEPSDVPTIILEAFAVQPTHLLKSSRDYFLVFDSEDIVRNMQPNQTLLNQINLGTGGIIVTAPSHQPEIDFVSRFFMPQASIFEDPVTGSTHCSLIPYWSQRLDKLSMTALQVSPRGGKLFCTYRGERVLISGQAVTYLEGRITI